MTATLSQFVSRLSGAVAVIVVAADAAMAGAVITVSEPVSMAAFAAGVGGLYLIRKFTRR